MKYGEVPSQSTDECTDEIRYREREIFPRYFSFEYFEKIFCICLGNERKILHPHEEIIEKTIFSHPCFEFTESNFSCSVDTSPPTGEIKGHF
jgi:hypothetical protein